MTYTIKTNPDFKSTEIIFEGKPSAAVRDALKALKFRWHNVNKLWYGYTDETTARVAIENAEQGTPSEARADSLTIPEDSTINAGTIYEGWQGGNYSKWRTDKELKALILNDCKKAGIKASLRFPRCGYLTSLTMTIYMPCEMLKPFDKCEFSIYDCEMYGRIDYCDESGAWSSIDINELNNMTEEARESLKAVIFKDEYRRRVNALTSSNTHYGRAVSVLTAEGKRLYDLAQTIVHSYNRDASDVMTDYFDRAIYDNYAIKFVD